MTKLISILAYCLIALCLCACTRQPPVPTQIDGSVYVTAAPVSMQAVLTAYGDFLSGSREANSAEGTVNRNSLSRLFTTENLHWEVEQIAVVDLHGDGIPEAVLALPDSIGYGVLSYQGDGDLFAQGIWYRAFQNLKTDGTYMGSGSSFDRVYYRQTPSDEIILAQCREDEAGRHYQVEGQTADEAAFAQFEARQKEKPDVLWYDSWEQLLSANS